MRNIVVLFLALFTILLPRQGFAQVFIEQGKVNLTVKAGETRSGEVLVNNSGDKPLRVKIYWEDFMYQPPYDGGKKFMPAGTSEHSMAGWIAFTPREATLAPYGKLKINYSINVPSSAQGGFYGVLFVEEDNPEMRIEKGVRIITRVGCLFFVETEDQKKQASVEGIEFDGPSLTGRFLNKGDVILIAKPTFYIMDREGAVSDRGEIKNLYVPPQQTASFAAPVADNLPPGEYTMVLTFDLDHGDVVVKEVDFTKQSDRSFAVNAVRD